MSSEKDSVPPERFLSQLVQLREAGINFVVVAGQSVNIWAQYFIKAVPELGDYLPFVSKDIDLLSSLSEVRAMETVLDGKLQRFKDVRQPMFGLFKSNTDPELQFDLLRSVYGPVSSERLKRRSQIVGGIPVIDPISLFVSKAHNVACLQQENRQDIRHLKILRLVVCGYFQLLYSRLGKELTERQLIDEFKYLFGFAADREMIEGLHVAEVNFADCLAMPQLRETVQAFPKLGRYYEQTLVTFVESMAEEPPV